MSKISHRSIEELAREFTEVVHTEEYHSKNTDRQLKLTTLARPTKYEGTRTSRCIAIHVLSGVGITGIQIFDDRNVALEEYVDMVRAAKQTDDLDKIGGKR